MCGSSLTEFKSSNSVENLFEAELSTWIFEKSLKNHFLSQTSFLILLWKYYEHFTYFWNFFNLSPKNAHKYRSNGDRLDTDPWSIKGKK